MGAGTGPEGLPGLAEAAEGEGVEPEAVGGTGAGLPAADAGPAGADAGLATASRGRIAIKSDVTSP